MTDDTRFYIDGAWVDRADTPRIPVTNPYSEEVIGHIAAGSAADVDLAVAAARRAFPSFSQTSVAERIALLTRIKDLLEERTEQFAQAITAEMGAAISFLARRAMPLRDRARARGDRGAEGFRVRRSGRRDPGDALRRSAWSAAITPWNWPLYQITAKLAPAFAAGCTVVLKPSELSPFSALLFAQVMHDAGTPPGVFNLVMGTGEEVGSAISGHPEVDMVSFTGSTRAGILVAQGAAPTIKRVVQELGGKSPNVFLPDADFASAVPKGVLGAMRNVGQSCAAPTRMVVPRARLAEVEALAAEAANGIAVGDPGDEGMFIGPLANKPQFDKVQALIQAGIDEGAKVIAGGTGLPQGLNHGYFARPTVFSEVTPRDAHRAGGDLRPGAGDPALRGRGRRDPHRQLRPSTASAATSSRPTRTRARRVARRIRAGQVHINYPAWSGFAPFGGYGQSGNGREYGRFALEEYLETKAILGY